MASGRLASDVVPINQSKKIYTNSSGGAVTANVHVQALSNTANACLSIRAVNNCAITPTSLVTAAACVCNFIGADSTLSCCGSGICTPQLNTYFNESDHSICGISEAGRVCRVSPTSGYGHRSPHTVCHWHYTSSAGCTFFPEHYNGGNDNTGLTDADENKVSEVHGGRGCICGAHTTGYYPFRGGSTYAVPDINCPTRIFPCFNYVLGFTRTSCCCFNGGNVCCFSFACSCGAHHKVTLMAASCFSGKTPDCIMCHQIVDSMRSQPGSFIRCFCHQLSQNTEYASNLAYVTHEPYMGTTIVLSTGIGSNSSMYCCFHVWDQVFTGGTGESGTRCATHLGCEVNCQICKFNIRICNNPSGSRVYQPFLVTNGAAIRNAPCRNADQCNDMALYMWEPGTEPTFNGIREIVRSPSGVSGQRVCGCRSLFWCMPSAQWDTVKWLQWNPTDNNIYVQYVVCGEGGIFTLNWSGGNPIEADTSLVTSSIITGTGGYNAVSDPVTDLCGTFCCKCVCYCDLPACMQTRSPTWFQHMAKDCFVGQWGEKIFRSCDLITWTDMDCYVCSKVSNATQFQENPSNFSCYFSTDNSCYCYSRNSFNELPCTGIYEYCVSANQLERSGLVLSNNDSLYINNESNTEAAAQVYGYEDS